MDKQEQPKTHDKVYCALLITKYAENLKKAEMKAAKDYWELAILQEVNHII